LSILHSVNYRIATILTLLTFSKSVLNDFLKMQNVYFLYAFQIEEIYEASYIKLYHLEMEIYQYVLHNKERTKL